MFTKHGASVNVILEEDLSNNPSCKHGPTLLFETVRKGKKVKFFACSACRNRKDCNFFQLYEDYFREKNKTKKKLVDIHKNVNYRVNHSIGNCQFCHTCQEIIHQQQLLGDHKSHHVIDNTHEDMKFPTKLLKPIENSKKEAQFYFTNSSAEFLANCFANCGFQKILCIGTPRLFEILKHRKVESLLLDIDNRFGCFYTANEYVRYNMFNHYFLHGEESKSYYLSFLRNSYCVKSKIKSLCVILDPPFGGRVEVLAHTIKLITEDWQKQNLADCKVELPGKRQRKLGSPVRIFTNFPANLITLPSNEGYRFCQHCNKWVHENNVHCDECQGCMTKDGKTYRHCVPCARCVKPSWRHCDFCQHCYPAGHCCKDFLDDACHICHSKDHKKKYCPNKVCSISFPKRKKIK